MKLVNLILMFGLIQFAVSACPDGWIKHLTNCYHFSHDKEPWANAMQICNLLGGHLLEIEDATENAYIAGQLSSRSHDYSAFTALSDLAEENIWVWMVSKAKLTETVFTNWDSGEPNNDGNENCVDLKHSGKWNDVECDASLYYICEKTDDDGVEIVG